MNTELQDRHQMLCLMRGCMLCRAGVQQNRLFMPDPAESHKPGQVWADRACKWEMTRNRSSGLLSCCLRSPQSADISPYVTLKAESLSSNFLRAFFVLKLYCMFSDSVQPDCRVDSAILTFSKHIQRRSMSTFQAPGQAPLHEVLQNGRFDHVGKLLDDFELQASLSAMSSAQ